MVQGENRPDVRVHLKQILALLSASLVSASLLAQAVPGPSLSARLASCDAGIVRAAIDELLRDPKTLQEPILLFQAASAELLAGRKEEAAFHYLAARLRSARQLLFVQGERAQVFSVMAMTVGPLISPIIESDPDLAKRVVDRVIKWDRATPDPFRDREGAKAPETAAKLAELDSGLARLPDQIRGNPERIAAARAANQQAELQIKSMKSKGCEPGRLDSIDVAAAKARIEREAEALAKSHPSIIARAGGPIRSASVGSSALGASGLPSRMTVMVSPTNGKMFFAEIDAEVTVTPDRKLGSLKVRLACITDLWVGERDARWRDVCEGDPKAIKPN